MSQKGLQSLPDVLQHPVGMVQSAERDGGAEIGTEERECTQRWDMERDALTVNSEA